MANKSLGWILLAVLGVVVYIVRGQGGFPFVNNAQVISSNVESSDAANNSEESSNQQGGGNTMEDLQNHAITFYINQVDQSASKESLKAVVKNYGCHVEVHVYQDEKLVRRLRWLYEFNADSFQ
jgi:MarR-like DNA-binding transcriptional regulator SgrR of sgrS sRNA